MNTQMFTFQVYSTDPDSEQKGDENIGCCEETATGNDQTNKQTLITKR